MKASFTQHVDQINIKRQQEQNTKSGAASYLMYKLASVFADLTATYEGRDKLTKGMQYSSKLMSWYYRDKDTT